MISFSLAMVGLNPLNRASFCDSTDENPKHNPVFFRIRDIFTTLGERLK
jgi:hypothetical protein